MTPSSQYVNPKKLATQKFKPKRPKKAPKPIKKNPPKAKPKVKKQKPVAPYNPYAPLDPRTIEANAKAQAQSQVQPELDTISSSQRELSGANATRQQELAGWYGNLRSSLDRSFTDTSGALNNLIALSGQAGTQSNEALVAALRQGNQGVDAAGAQMGVGPSGGINEAQILAAAQASSSNQANFTTANSMGSLAAQGERRGLADIGRIDAGNKQNREYQSGLKEIQDRRLDVTRRLPDLTRAAKQDIQANEAQKMQLSEAKKGRLFQEYLAQQELGLKKKNESFQEWLGKQTLSLDKKKLKSQTAIDWANVALNQRQIEAQMARFRADAKSDSKAESSKRAALRGKQWENGLSALNEYMMPLKGEGAPGLEDPAQLVDNDGNPLKLYRRRFDDALRLLTGQVRMSRRDALTMLSASDFPSWRSRARRELKKTTTLKKSLRPLAGKSGSGSSGISKTPPKGSGLR